MFMYVYVNIVQNNFVNKHKVILESLVFDSVICIYKANIYPLLYIIKDFIWLPLAGES